VPLLRRSSDGVFSRETHCFCEAVAHRRERCRPRGFTLVELLVTITIIAILAAAVLGALQSARQTAREAKTKSLITRLDRVIMERYESYQTRRVPISTAGMQPSAAARARLNALRDLMRMEMPDRWTDVIQTPSDPPSSPPTDTPLLQGTLSPSALTHRYWRTYARAWQQQQTANPTGAMQRLHKWGAAECLYMIVMSCPGADEQFGDNEKGDIDEDGLPEFHDGWGRPIRFIRWPAGFVPSLYADTTLQTDNPDTNPDPFDSRGLMGGYALYPLIYSAGPDGRFDINIGKAQSGSATFAYALTNGDLDPYLPDGSATLLIGQPKEEDKNSSDPIVQSDLQHYDNIHNHRTEAR